MMPGGRNGLSWRACSLILLLGLLGLALSACGREPSTPPTEKSFKAGGISFKYPAVWHQLSQETVDQVRRAVKHPESEILGMFKTPDELVVISIIRGKNSANFDDFYRQKVEAKAEVAAITLPNGSKAIRQYASDPSTKMRLASYQFLANGYEYDVNFIHKDKEALDKYGQDNRKIVDTVKFQQ